MNSNTITVTGRLGHNPEIRHTKTGKAVCDLSLAVNERVRRGAGFDLVTTWHRIVLWQGLAEDARSLRKGSAIRVEGFQKSRTWEGRSGEKRTTVELMADNFTVLDSLPQSASPNGSRPTSGGVPKAQIPGPEWDSV